MPIRFTCPSCRRLLGVAVRKIGHDVSCPVCGTSLVVPAENDAVAAMATSKALWTESQIQEVSVADLFHYDDPPLWPDTSAEQANTIVTAPSDTPADFPRLAPPAAISPAPAVAGPAPPAASVPHASPTTKALPGAVTFPRYVLYAQAALITVLALVAFGLGFVFGRAGKVTQSVVMAPPEPVRVEGSVAYEVRPGKVSIDRGAVIIAIPQDALPAQKLSIRGLRPQDSSKDDLNNLAIKVIESLDGSFLRASELGTFELLAKPGRYHVLVISRNAMRPKNSRPDPGDLDLLHKYFDAPQELLGNYHYVLAVRQLPDENPIDVEFAAGH